MLALILKNKTIKAALEKSATGLIGKFGTLIVIIGFLLWLAGTYNLIQLPESIENALGINRQDSTQVESIIAGKLESRAILAESEREFTGNALFSREGGVLNCAGEEQAIKNGSATARSTVSATQLEYQDTADNGILIRIPEAQLAGVDLDENLEIINTRNPCVRLVQIFGNTTSENEVRTLLKDEITEVAREDTELFTSAECSALNELKTILSNAGADIEKIAFEIQENDRPLNTCSS